MKKRLTPKQAALARAKVRFPDATLAELAVLSKYADAATANDALKSAPVKERIIDLMNKHLNLTDAGIAKKISEKMEAKETKFFQKDGVVTDSREVEAHGIQMDAARLASQLKGHLTNKIDVTSDGKSIVSLLSQED